MKKRFIACLTAGIMIFSMLGIQSISAQTSVAADDSSLNFLTSLGIVEAGDKDYTTKISREEFSLLLAKARRLEGVTDGVRYFRDVESDSYTASAINLLAQHRIISVPEDKKFRPGEAVLYEEACKMIICALGYDMIAESNGGFPLGYIMTASRIDIKMGTTGKAITYYDAFKMLRCMLEAELPDVESVDENGIKYTTGAENSLLSEYWDIYKIKGCLESIYGQSLSGNTVTKKNRVILSGVVYEKEETLDADKFFGGYVTAYYRDANNQGTGTIVYLEDAAKANTIEIMPEDFVEATSNGIAYYNESGRKTTLSLSSPKFVYNGRPLMTDVQNVLENINKGSIQVKDGDRNGDYDVVIIKDYKNFVVSTISNGKIYNKLVSGDAINKGEYKSEKIIANSGTETDYSVISVGTVLSVARSLDSEAIEILVSESVVQGAIDEISDDNGFYCFHIGGTKYRLDKSYGISLFGTNGQKESSLISSGKQYEFKLDSFGNIVYMSVAGSTLKTGVIVKSALQENALSQNVILKVLVESGTLEKLTVSDKVKINGETYKNAPQKVIDVIDDSVDKLFRYAIDEEGYI